MRYGAGFKLITVAALLLGPVAAAGAEDEDAPGRGVARISAINGDVSVRRGDSGDWVAAAVNAPLVAPDAVATGPGSRAEVQLDYANVLRLGPNAEVRLTEIENRRYQMQVARGTVEFRVLRDTDADIEVSTPQVSVRPSKKGAYRVTVYEDGQQAEITVRSGEAEIYTPTGVERLSSGRSMVVRSGGNGPEYQATSAPPRDDFDRWNEERDRYLERSDSYRYVSPSIYGAEDLYGHGRWVYDPGYGWVWVPSVGPGWAPYSHGRWVWQDWYGWTWLSYDPWGWAPFHYGRWYHGHHGWAWYPGARVSVHFWRPALVAFFGFGHGVHVGVGFGSVGWVPLAPYERFHPWYGRGYYGRGYYDRSIHVTNINVTNVYRNARVRNAVSAVGYDDFGRGRNNIQRVGELREASLMKGPLPVGPGRESIRFSDREVRSVPRSSAGAEKFYARRQPTPVQRVSFADQQRSFRVASESRAAQPAPVARGEGAARDNGGWRRAGQPATSPAEAVKRSNENGGGNAGWRRFGERPQTATPEQPRASESATRSGNAIGRTRESAPGGGASDSQKRGGEWRRFGDRPQTATPEQPRTSEGAARPGNAVGRTRESAPAQTAPDRRGASDSQKRGGDWRRFGESAPAAPRETAPQAAPQRRSEDAVRSVPRTNESRGNWQRFGEPGQAAPARRSESPSPVSRGWQGFGNPSSAPQSSRGPERVSRSESYSRPSVRQEPIRIAPPVVRERSSESAPRSAPHSESRGYSRESGNSGRGSERSNGHGNGRNR